MKKLHAHEIAAMSREEVLRTLATAGGVPEASRRLAEITLAGPTITEGSGAAARRAHALQPALRSRWRSPMRNAVKRLMAWLRREAYVRQVVEECAKRAYLDGHKEGLGGVAGLRAGQGQGHRIGYEIGLAHGELWAQASPRLAAHGVGDGGEPMTPTRSPRSRRGSCTDAHAHRAHRQADPPRAAVGPLGGR
jgi:hypothetical protein